MNVVSILSQKGGAGKTTLALHLAVAISQESPNTVVIDVDPQESSWKWSQRRDNDLPVVIQSTPDALEGDLERMRSIDASWVIVDTPPNSDDATRIASLSDLVVVPCRPSILDLEAIMSTVGLVEGTPTWVVLNCVRGRKEADQAERGLKAVGVNVAEVRLSLLQAYASPFLAGLTGIEREPGGTVSKQVHDLVELVKKWVNE